MSQYSEQPEFDSLAMWRQFQAASLQVWAKTMSDYVGTEEFARSMGQQLDSFLAASAPMQQQVDAAMEKYLAQVNLPSRSEVVTLAERLTHLEMRLDDIDAKLDELLDLVRPSASGRETPADDD